MANEKAGKWVKYFASMFSSMAGILISYLANIDSHPIMQNLQTLELGKLTFTVVATAATQGLFFSPNFPDTHQPHYFLVLGLMIGCAVIWNGILFQIIYIQLLGITLILCLLCFLVGSFLPVAFFWVCCLPAALFLVPFIYLLQKPQPAPAPVAGGDDA
ncbi:hypothetical protein C2S51_035156 [Perilla frutescens var. frutescens]|nr:hypothetical protein C2S51_035156 [Perilla frutescens var. frutescens]